MAAFLSGVPGLTAVKLVATDTKQEPEHVLTPLPRGMEKTVKVTARRVDNVTTDPAQHVSDKSYVKYSSRGLASVIKNNDDDDDDDVREIINNGFISRFLAGGSSSAKIQFMFETKRID